VPFVVAVVSCNVQIDSHSPIKSHEIIIVNCPQQKFPPVYSQRPCYIGRGWKVSTKIRWFSGSNC
jgi:hypothetical protein